MFHDSKFSKTAKYLMTDGHFSEALQMEAFLDVSKVFENTVKCIEFHTSVGTTQDKNCHRRDAS